MAGTVSIQYAGLGYGSTGENERLLPEKPTANQLTEPSTSSDQSVTSSSDSSNKWPVTSNASANFARIIMLIINVGTQATAAKVKENLPDSMTLKEALKQKYGRMCSLVGNRVINQGQLEILYPQGDLDENAIDLTLWVVLLRNLPAKTKIKWVEDPKYKHQKFWHDIQRLKMMRNKLAHIRKAELDEKTFKQMWEETVFILLRLDVSQRVTNFYLQRDLEPEAVLKVKDQFLDDLLAGMAQRKDQIRKLKIGLFTICFLVIISLITTLVVALRHDKQWESCARNLKYANTGDALVSYILREGWGARRPNYKEMERLHTPVEYVIITHTAQVTSSCYTTDDCCMTVRVIQDLHMDNNGWSDIGFSYVIGGDGIVFIGRGDKYVMSAAKYWNRNAISIAFIGLFTRRPPHEGPLDALTVYLDYLVQTNVTTPNYTLYGLCQVRETFPDAPGAAFMKELIRMFPDHWKNDNITNCNMNMTGY